MVGLKWQEKTEFEWYREWVGARSVSARWTCKVLLSIRIAILWEWWVGERKELGPMNQKRRKKRGDGMKEKRMRHVPPGKTMLYAVTVMKSLLEKFPSIHLTLA